MPRDRLRLVLNRVAEDGRRLKDFEHAVDRPIAATLPNDYQRTLEASQGGRLVEEDSPLGRAYVSLAQELVGAEPLVPPPEEGQGRRGLRGLFKGLGAGS